MLAISADSSGKVIFKQKRAGLYGKPFTFYKFRTMLPGAPRDVATADLFQAHRYITPVGRFLRQTSLDELPQLFNVLKGDMSFVGPRPVVLTERHLLELRRRWGADRVRPGITGLAQIRGRDQVPYRRKALYDRYYARHLSPWLDGKILWVTVRYVLKREGIREGALHPGREDGVPGSAGDLGGRPIPPKGRCNGPSCLRSPWGKGRSASLNPLAACFHRRLCQIHRSICRSAGTGFRCGMRASAFIRPRRAEVWVRAPAARSPAWSHTGAPPR